MGSAVSIAKDKAAEKADETDNDLQNLMSVLRNKRDYFLTIVAMSRVIKSGKEVTGGRTVSRVSDIRVQTKTGIDEGIKDAISDFFKAAQGGDNAKKSAVKGAEALLLTGLDALFGAGEGIGRQKKGFVVLFMNYSFVRIDFLVYTYSVKGAMWGAEAGKSGSCYVADIAVLDSGKDLRPSEIDYLIAQSFAPEVPVGQRLEDSKEFNIILRMKLQLVESAILSRMLEKEDIALKDLREYTDELVRTQKNIQDAFAELEDYVPAPIAAA